MNIQIFIISENEDLHLLEDCLAGMQGCKTKVYRGIFNAISELMKRPADLIVIDTEGFKSSSGEILEAINRACPESQLIIISGHLNGRISGAYNGGAGPYNSNVICSFSRPFVIDKLFKTIKEYIKRKSSDSQLQRNINMGNDSSGSIPDSTYTDHYYAEKLLMSISNMDELTDIIVEVSTGKVNAEKCSLMLLDDDRQTLSINKAKGFNGNQSVVKDSKIKLGEGIAGLVALEGKALLVTDTNNERKFRTKYSVRYKSSSFISIPLKIKSDIMGVLNLTDKIDNHRFTEQDLHSLSAFTTYASAAIKNALIFQELQNLSVTDGLTGLYNRRHFYNCLEKEIIRSGRYGRNFILAILDIDKFKHYNDTYGHLAGDSVLKQVSEILKIHTRSIDIVARYGGEEFAIIFPETHDSDNLMAATVSGLHFPERLRKAVDGHNFSNISNGEKLGVTISGGVARFPHDGTTEKGLVSIADENLYYAKRGGRNMIYVDRICPGKQKVQKNTAFSGYIAQGLPVRLHTEKALLGCH
jgi:diguanylate cyclase (GGDEF)-like protein